MSVEKTSPESSPDVELRTPAHGHGALQVGNPGNKGGGRPPSEIREKLRGSFAERIAVLESIADNPESKPRDRIQAIEMLAKYGLGTRQEVTGEDGEPIAAEIAVVRKIIDGAAQD